MRDFEPSVLRNLLIDLLTSTSHSGQFGYTQRTGGMGGASTHCSGGGGHHVPQLGVRCDDEEEQAQR